MCLYRIKRRNTPLSRKFYYLPVSKSKSYLFVVSYVSHRALKILAFVVLKLKWLKYQENKKNLLGFLSSELQYYSVH